MSRRTFEALVTYLGNARPGKDTLDYPQWFADVTAVAYALQSLNRAFDPQRFVRDCLTYKPPS